MLILKNIIFSIFLLITYPQAHYFRSLIDCFKDKFSVIIMQASFKFAQHLFEEREGSGAGSVPLANGSRSGRPENMRRRKLLGFFMTFLITISVLPLGSPHTI
jgi:hypothetical protein